MAVGILDLSCHINKNTATIMNCHGLDMFRHNDSLDGFRQKN